MNDKQQRFVDEYTLDHNATQAAIRAGYSAKTAYSQGHDLLKNPEIRAAVAEREANLADELGITKQKLLAAQWQVFEKALTGSPKVDREGRVVTATSHAGHDDEEPCTDGCRTAVVYEWSPAGANKALETLMRHRGMLVDRHDVQVDGGVRYEIVGITTEDLK